MCTKKWSSSVTIALYFIVMLSLLNPVIIFFVIGLLLQKLTMINDVLQIFLTICISYFYYKDWMKVRSYFYKTDIECMKFFRN